MKRLVRSSAFRIALAFAIAVTATTYVVFALVYLQFYRSNVALARRVLETEVRGTIGNPTDRLQERLRLRLTQDLRHLDYVGLFDRNGRLLLGNVPPGLAVPPDGKAHLIRLAPPQPADAPSAEALVVAARRTDGGVFILGRSLGVVDELAGAMLRAFAAAIGPVVVLALVVGAFVSVRASRRLSTIQDAIRRVMGGELAVRLPARGTPDDVDELVRAVNAMLDEIVRLLNQIKSVGDNIAHDLRAPLAVMRARLERGLASDAADELRTLVCDALADLERAMTTVTALLRISELESGLRRGFFAEVDLAAIARDTYELYAPLAEANGITMTLIANSPVPVFGDGDLLREALVNLLDNAVKFTPPGGSISVTSGEGDALLGVADNGPGVAPHERTRILRRFYRAAATNDRPGHGLGLSMAATIVDLHGFALRIGDNHPGAIFEILAEPTSKTSGRPYARAADIKRNLMEGFPRTT